MATSKTAWKKARTHEVTLPSGAEVVICLPNVPKLIAGGQMPNGLLEAAIKFKNAVEVTPEMMKEQWPYSRYLAAATVVEPALTEEDVEELPAEDIEKLVELATRQTDIDALGHHIAGLDKVADFRRFRGFPERDEAVVS